MKVLVHSGASHSSLLAPHPKHTTHWHGVLCMKRNQRTGTLIVCVPAEQTVHLAGGWPWGGDPPSETTVPGSIIPWREVLLPFSISRLFINKMGSVYSTFGQMCTMSFKFVVEEIKTKTEQNKNNFTRLMVCKLHAKQSMVEVSQEAKATWRK